MLASKDIKKTMFFGPTVLKVEDLVQLECKKDGYEGIKESIEKVGIVNPLDVCWVLGETQLSIHRGNRRYEAIKELGWTKVPCRLKVIVPKGYEEVGEMLKKVMTFITEHTGETAKYPKNEDVMEVKPDVKPVKSSSTQDAKVKEIYARVK